MRDLEAAALDQVDELGKPIAPPMLAHLVVAAPKPHEGRHGEQQETAGLELCPEGLDRCAVIPDMLDDVEGRDDVEGDPFERKITRQGAG
jgi:hypothetical protein